MWRIVMSKSEKAIITVLCMVYDGNKLLLQDRVKNDWKGLTFPGGHVEKEESFVQAVIREVYEETGLTIAEPRLCGVKQFQTEEEERYIVFLFKTDQFSGTLVSSEEGEMKWIDRGSLDQLTLVEDFTELLKVFDSESLNEFKYERQQDNHWIVRLF
jgi:8-oxo-dGTP diphosphatase